MEKRLYIYFIFVLGLFTVITARLFYWQILSFESLKGIASLQVKRERVIEPKRGRLFSHDGSELVINQRSYLLYAEPEKIRDLKRASQLVAHDLGMEEGTVSSRIGDNKKKWVIVKDRLDQESADRIKGYKIEGLGFESGYKRYYPEGSMAAQLLGFVGKNSKGEDQGYFGLEGFYNDQLKGRSGFKTQEIDPAGNPINIGQIQTVEAIDGRDLYLSVDKTIQFILEKKLSEGIQKYGAKAGSVIVMDPKKGSILGMASFPSYDPRNTADYPDDVFKNPIVASSYEPGSTFKVLVMAAAINEDKIKPDTTYDEKGALNIGGFEIKTWNQQYHGQINMAQVLQYSSNVGMVFVSDALGHDLLFDYLKRLNFGEKTGIDLEDENSPVLRDKNKWYEIDYATASFGQGIAVTPLQMIRAVSAIANGGDLMKPYVVERISDSSGKIINIKPKIEKKIFSKKTSELIKEMMVYAVENGETRFLKPVGVRIAGKTGTAQIAISGHYDTQKTIASFVGFAPADNPRYIMLVTLNQPTSSPWGSETAAPLFFSISKDLISYLNIN